MQTQYFIGAGAGLVSMALFASTAGSGVFAGIPIYLSPLPLCLAGLGWGRSAVLIGALTGTLLMIVALGAAISLPYALAVALPTALLVHLVLLSRTVPAADGTDATLVAWYPLGRLVGTAAIIAGVLAGLTVLALGPSEANYQATIDRMTPHLIDAFDPERATFTPEVIDKFNNFLAKALPAVVAIVWGMITLLNLWVAGRVVQASGHALRPWPDLHGLELPNVYVIVFAVVLALSFLPGMLGLIATGFVGALLFAYTLQGLAVIHVYSQRLPFRAGFLAMVYLGVLLLGWVAILVAIIGLGEPMFGLRSRNNAAAPPPPSSTNDDSN